MNQEKCPCCHNHCDKNNLKCERGQRHFNNLEDNTHQGNTTEKIIFKLRKCGHLLHHNKELKPQKLLEKLSLEELSTLDELLSKIISDNY